MKKIKEDLLDYIFTEKFMREDFDQNFLKGPSHFTERLFSEEEFLSALDTAIIPDSELKVRSVDSSLNHFGLTNSVNGDFLKTQLLRGNWSAVFNGAHKYLSTEALNNYFEKLTAQYNSVIRSNIFYTKKDNNALPFHWDTHNLFAFQMQGKKRWEIFEPKLEHPLPFMNLDTMPELRTKKYNKVADFVLEPGQAIYVPRGYGHRVTTDSDYSLHFTFGIHPVSIHDSIEVVVANTLNRLQFEDDFRQSINLIAVTENELSYFQSLFKEELLKAMKFYQATTKRNIMNESPISFDEAFQNMSHSEVVVKYPVLHLQNTPNKNEVRLIVGNKKQFTNDIIPFHFSMERTLRDLIENGRLPFSTVLDGIGVESLFVLYNKNIVNFKQIS